jgi:FNIP Repeat
MEFHVRMITEYAPSEMIYVSKACHGQAIRNMYNTHILEEAEKYLPTFRNKFRIIRFSYDFNDSITLGKKVKIVVFGDDFNQPVILPEGIQAVVFGKSFNQEVVLPKSLKVIVFGHSFNQEVILPEGITTASFGCSFDKNVYHPESLVTVSFGCLDDPDRIITNCVELVVFGKCFWQGILPEILQYDVFGDKDIFYE